MSGEFNEFQGSPEGIERPKAGYEYEEEDLELEQALGQIWDIAEEFHLEPFPTHFDVVPPKVMNQLGAYGGLQGRYSHWTRGREYRQMKTMYDWGLSKVYELVINSNPAQAFLLENNPPIENKFVMAHVLGHTDFFKNNYRFAETRRDMPVATVKSAERISSYEAKEGTMEVEKFLDAVLSIEEHVDPYLLNRPTREDELAEWRAKAKKRQESPPDGHDEFEDILGPAPVVEKKLDPVMQIPPSPDRDILGFIRNHAPYLEGWQRDIVDIVRSESVYFHPQRRTKIMNEGWAAYWHKRIMREMGSRDLITDQENEAWSIVHSNVVRPSSKSLNPYYLGMMVYEYIEDYYNGTLTDEENAWLTKEDIPVMPRFEGDLKDSPAMPVLREVMIHNDDQSFIRNHFNKIVSDRMNMFIYDERIDWSGEPIKIVREGGWQEIREYLVSSMDNAGMPYIVVVDGDHNNAGELYLRHEPDGKSLDPEYIEKTLPYIHKLWQRPLHLETIDAKSGDKLVYSYKDSKLSTASYPDGS